MKILTAFFSMTGETIAKGGVIVLEKGYTRQAAEFVHAAVGGELFHIEQERAYDPDHFKMIYEAKEEIDGDERPALKAMPEDVSAADRIFLCYPNWWNALPQPVVTFLTGLDLAGKRIIPLCTSGGGGFGHSREDIAKYAPGATVEEGLTVPGAQVQENEQRIMDWAKTWLAD